MNPPPFSIVCVYNDRETLESFLFEGLEDEPDELYELTLVDNRDGRFDSAAAALNHGAQKTSGEYLIFVHQDVKFIGDNWLEQAREHLYSVDNLGSAGLTGFVKEGADPLTKGRNVIFHGSEREPWDIGQKIDSPTQVQTVDELMMIIPRNEFERRGFNEEVCDGWHFYAVERCLYTNQRTRKESYVLPLPVWHGSKGMPRTGEYYRQLRAVAAEYPDVDVISTTCGLWLTNWYYLLFVHLSVASLSAVLPSKATKIVQSIWPSIFGGAVVALWLEGFDSVRIILRFLYKRGVGD